MCFLKLSRKYRIFFFYICLPITPGFLLCAWSLFLILAGIAKKQSTGSNEVNYMTVGENNFPFNDFSQSLIWWQTWVDFPQTASSVVYMQIILCVNPLGFYDSYNHVWLGNLLAYLDPYLHCALWGWKCYSLLLVASQCSLQQRDTELFHCKPHPQQLLGTHFAYRHVITDQVRRNFHLF